MIINDPLFHEFYFTSIFEINLKPRIGSNRLPTHRRGAHWNFLHEPFLFQNCHLGKMSFVDDAI